MKYISKIPIFFFIFILQVSLVHALCNTPDDFRVRIIDPLGQYVSSPSPYYCDAIITYTNAVSQSCPSTVNCNFVYPMPTNCQMRGQYLLDCLLSTQCGADQNMFLCDYDHCANCCTAGTSYQWNIGGEVAATACCGDDSGEYSRTCLDSSDQGDCGSDTLACCNANNKCVDQNGGCRNSGACYGSSVFGNSYCDIGTWQSPEEGSGYCVASCDITSGDAGIGYNIGGEISSTTCCGDDSGEYMKTRNAGTDSTYTSSSSDNGCCNSANECIYSDICYDSSSTSGSIPTMNYCNGGVWQGGDTGQVQCTAIAGTNRWSIGGEVAPTACCGDDNAENRKIETQGNDSPSLFDDGTDACCDPDTDCAENNACYANTLVIGTIPNKGYCNSGTWQGGDTGQVQCTAIAGTNRWSIGGEVAPTACCGDDTGEKNRSRIVKSYTGTNDVTTNLSDKACCDSSTDCIFNGVCYIDRDEAITLTNQTCQGYSQTQCNANSDCEWHMGSCRIKTDLNGMQHIYDSSYKDQVYKDINNDSIKEICDPGEWLDPALDPVTCVDLGGIWLDGACCGDTDPDPDCDATFYGNVKDIDDNNIENASVEFTGASKLFLGKTYHYNINTDSFGNYNINVMGNATYDILVSKLNYQSASTINQYIEIGESKGVNFTLVSSFEQCTDDCTFKDDEYCHASCDNRNGCQFNSSETKIKCNGKLKWVVEYNETHEVICCEGLPSEKKQLKVSGIKTSTDIENIVRLVRLVVFRGKPTKMIVDVFK